MSLPTIPVRENETARRSRWLDAIERIGNALPDAVTIFVLLAVAVAICSWFAERSGFSAAHPVTGKPVSAVNLLTAENLRRFLMEIVPTFVGFTPLGVVLAAMIGIGVAERSGLIETALRGLVDSVAARWVTPAIVLAGMLSHSAADAGFVILPPIAAAIYARIGRNPIAGVAAAFAGVGGGFSANLLLSPIDPMLAGISQEAARILDPNYTVRATANYFFLSTSVVLLVILATWVSRRFVEPRLGACPTPVVESSEPITPRQKRGLLAAGVVGVLFILAVVLMTVPEGGLLRDSDKGLKPFFDSLIALIMLLFMLCGLAYGLVARTVRSDRDVSRMMSETLATMGNYIVLAFFASQALALFKWSQLGPILAVEGATMLKKADFDGIPLFLGVILITTTINLIMASASAKWTMMAPVFVPMMMVMGYAPETTQALYRVGDSVTNIITPLSYYLPSIVVPLCKRYDPRAGLGTVIAMMLPYSIAFGLAWTVLLIVWLHMGWPVGPGAPLNYAIAP